MQEKERPPRKKEGLDRAEIYRVWAEKFFREHATVESCIEAFLDAHRAKRARIFALLAAAINASHARAFALNHLQRRYDFSKIPIDPNQYTLHEEILGTGYWKEVYRLEPKKEGLPRRVLKIEYPAKKYSVDHLQNVVQGYREDDTFMTKAYQQSLSELIPETHYFVSTSPRTRQPAIAALQAYAGDDPFDLLDSGNAERVQTLLREDPEFKREVDLFIGITMRLDALRKAPDLAGKSNVLVVKKGTAHTLRLVDHHSFDEDNTFARSKHDKKFAYLKALVKGL